jgi:hypothetical protein
MRTTEAGDIVNPRELSTLERLLQAYVFRVEVLSAMVLVNLLLTLVLLVVVL